MESAILLADTFQAEPLTDALWGELMPLMAAHCAEVGPFPDLPFSPHKAAYERMAAANAFVVYTARYEGAVVGYGAFFISPSLHHYPAIFAQADVLYVMPQQRCRLLGFGLIQYCHDQLRARGVQRVCGGSKVALGKSIAPLLDRLGYVEVDSVWWKELTYG